MAGKFLSAIRARFFNTAADTAIDVGVAGEQHARLAVDAGGRLTWGSGSESGDVNLYRSAANTLTTDDVLDSQGLYVYDTEITTVGASTNYALVYNGTAFVPTKQKAQEIYEATGEPIGFPTRTDSTISFDAGNRRFSIAPVATSYDVWCKGVRYVKSTTETVDIPNTSGLYYIYFSSTGVLSYKTSYFTWDSDTPIAYVYWNATDGAAYFFADERHGVVLDWQTHEYLHRTRGAAIASGFGALGYTVVGDGSADSHAQISIADGTFFDEDLQVDVTHSSSPAANSWEQILNGPAQIPVFYRSGSVWKKATATQFPLRVGTALATYNLNTAGTWSTPDIGSNKFGISWVVATNNLDSPILALLGQGEYGTQGEADAVTFDQLDLTDFPVFEFRPLYKIVYRTKTDFTNSVKSAFTAVWDLRTIIPAGGGVPTTPVLDHGSQAGLADDDHLQYMHTSTARTVTAVHTFSNGLTSNGTVATSVLTVDGIELDTTSSTQYQVLMYNGTKYIPTTIIPTGGNAGQSLIKLTNANYDFSWATITGGGGGGGDLSLTYWMGN
jgi:hypothetical protein